MGDLLSYGERASRFGLEMIAQLRAWRQPGARGGLGLALTGAQHGFSRWKRNRNALVRQRGPPIRYASWMFKIRRKAIVLALLSVGFGCSSSSPGTGTGGSGGGAG